MAESRASTAAEAETRPEIEALRSENERLVLALEFERRRMYSLLAQAPAFIAVVHGEEHVYTFVNDAYCAVTGRTGFLGKTVREMLPELGEQGFLPVLERVFATGVPWRSGVVPVVLTRQPDALPERRYVDFVYQPLVEADGTTSGVLLHGVDVTDATVAEQQLRQSQKMDAVGRLAGGVAHDFNNLLSVILSYADLATDSIDESNPARADIREIQLAGQRARELTAQLLAFSRKQLLQPRTLDLGALVSAMPPQLTPLLGDGIELSVIVAPDLGRVLADAVQVEQVVTNLVTNARDSMPRGGKLTIEVANVELERAYLSDAGHPVSGSFVMIATSDTGQGLDAEACANVFEPFYTTRGKGKGTGLALATVLGIVQQSDGYVGVHSEVGRGSSFKVYLPRTDRVVQPTGGGPGRGSETLLVVERDDAVRAVACTILRRHGYVVLEASSGAAAGDAAAAFGGAIHLLLTDPATPSGEVDVAQRLAADRPSTRVLYASGYPDGAVVRHGVLGASAAFLQKPFTPDALLRKVRAVLDGA